MWKRRAESKNAATFAITIERALDLHCAQLHRQEAIRHTDTGVVVCVDAEGDADALFHRLDDITHLASQRATVGVAKHEDPRPPVLRAGQEYEVTSWPLTSSRSGSATG